MLTIRRRSSRAATARRVKARLGRIPVRARGGGFTFLELIVVVVILGLIFTLGGMRISSSIPKYRIRSAAREVARKLEEMRMVAITRGSWTGMRYHLDVERPGYEQLPPARPDNPFEPVEDRTPLERVDFETPNGGGSYPGVTIKSVLKRGLGQQADSSGVVDVYFSPTGTTGSHVITLEHRDGRLYSISFNALTGVIDFHEGEDVGFADVEE